MTNISTEKLLEAITEALTDNKARQVTIMNLDGIEAAVCKYFVVCHGTSRTHVASLAQNVATQLNQNLGERPWKKEGVANGEWVLLDYSDVVVHVFQESTRAFYNIEGLWADAKIEVIEDEF